MHEVVVNENTLKAVDMARQEGRSLWRISSTVRHSFLPSKQRILWAETKRCVRVQAFGHIRGDVILKPLEHFGKCERASEYPPTLAKEYVAAEVRAIKLQK